MVAFLQKHWGCKAGGLGHTHIAGQEEEVKPVGEAGAAWEAGKDFYLFPNFMEG